MGGKPQGYFALGPGLAGEGVGRRGAEVEGRGGWGDGVDAEVRTGQRRRLRQMLERLDAMEIRAAQ